MKKIINVLLRWLKKSRLISLAPSALSKLVTGTPYSLSTISTPYGLISIYNHEEYISVQDHYWEIEGLKALKKFIDPNKNILEAGAHVGTSTLFYAHCLHQDAKLYAFEPQKRLYELLLKNIEQNNLQDKIEPHNKALFCFEGTGRMNHNLYDGKSLFNFGGTTLGKNGEKVEFVIGDHLALDNIGFIHMDAQGAENHIFAGLKNTITKYRPVIYFENAKTHYKDLFEDVCNSYPDYQKEAAFDIVDFCMKELGYAQVIREFQVGDDLLLPNPI